MRRVYLTREKRFAGCFTVLQVYIEDQARGNVDLDGIPCRLIGDLANGETIDFAISEEARHLFVICESKVMKNYCGDKIFISPGDTDIELVGRNIYNPGLGNPFRFNGVTDEETLSNRARENRKGLALTVAAVIIGIVFGVIISADSLFVQPKSFISDGFEITLTTNFSDKYEDGVYYFGSKDCSVAVYEYGYADHVTIEAMDAEQFLGVLQSSGHFAKESHIVSESGLFFVEDQAESNSGDIRSYMTVFVKGDESFFLFEFGCEVKDYSELRSDFIEWASTIKIK